MVSSTLPITTQRFSQMVNRPGGMTLADATKSADANIESIRDLALGEINEILDRMYDIGATPSSAMDCGKLYDLSNTIVSVAGTFGLAHLGVVAYSLCELLDRLRLNNQKNQTAIEIHLNSLRLMQALAPQDMGQADLVHQALRQLVDSIPAAPSAIKHDERSTHDLDNQGVS